MSLFILFYICATYFTLSGGTVTAAVDASRAMDWIDLGIAKLHFQIGAGQGQWAWGDGGLFIHK